MRLFYPKTIRLYVLIFLWFRVVYYLIFLFNRVVFVVQIFDLALQILKNLILFVSNRLHSLFHVISFRVVSIHSLFLQINWCYFALNWICNYLKKKKCYFIYPINKIQKNKKTKINKKKKKPVKNLIFGTQILICDFYAFIY